MLVFVLLGLSAFFSGSETAFFTLNPVQRKRVSASPGGAGVISLLAQPERLLSSILLGNTLVNVAASSVTSVLLEQLLPGSLGLGVAVIGMTLVLLVAGEISPKLYASANAERVATRVSLPIRIIVAICTPASWILSRISRIALRLSGAGGSQKALSSSEIISLLELGHSEGVLGNEALVTVALMTLEERQCSEAMCPRSAVGVIRTGWTREKTLSVVRSSSHTLYPLLEGSLDKVLGFVDSRDVLAGRGDALDVCSMPSFTEHAPLDSVLRSLRDSGDAMGAVYDEYGDWAGIITIEDILNYAVFHSMSGQTELPDGVSRRGRGFVVPGMLRLDMLARLIDADLPGGLAETCAGLFLETAGRVPVPGDEVSAGQVRMTVLSRLGPRIDTLYVERVEGGRP